MTTTDDADRELTDAECDEFRRLPGAFNDMVRAIWKAAPRRAPSAPTPPELGSDADQMAGLEALWQDARAKIAGLERERDEWKANHDNQVNIKRCLAVRPDLPAHDGVRQQLAAETLRADAAVADAARMREALLSIQKITTCDCADRVDAELDADGGWHGSMTRCPRCIAATAAPAAKGTT